MTVLWASELVLDYGSSFLNIFWKASFEWPYQLTNILLQAACDSRDIRKIYALSYEVIVLQYWYEGLKQNWEIIALHFEVLFFGSKIC